MIKKIYKHSMEQVIENLDITGPKNLIFVIDDKGRIFEITLIVVLNYFYPAFKRMSLVRESLEEFNFKVNKFDEIEKILEEAKNYELKLSKGGNIVFGSSRTKKYLVKEILKVHSYEEKSNYVIINCDYSVNYKNINYNSKIEINKSINNWEELYELLKNMCIRDNNK